MAQDLFHYDKMVEAALRGVVRDALKRAAREGLRSAHHFYIGFDTRAPGVDIPDHLHARYPEDMTIILQHQFWDLVVTEDRFEVGLSFGGIPERLVVPFAAVKRFLDPSAPFDLQFEPSGAEAPQLPAVPAPSALPVAAPEPAAESKDESAKTSEGAEVVRLDRFRKK